jgi:predicted neutral ceramidase superfamily lipid hydrolase
MSQKSTQVKTESENPDDMTVKELQELEHQLMVREHHQGKLAKALPEFSTTFDRETADSDEENYFGLSRGVAAVVVQAGERHANYVT